MALPRCSAALAALAVVRFGEQRGVVGDAVLVVIVLERRLDDLLREHGAVDLVRRQAVERLHHGLVRELQHLVDGLALDELGVKAENCLAVGDRYDMDIALPLEMGMGGILVKGVEEVYQIPKSVL